MAGTKTPANQNDAHGSRLPSTRERRPALAALAVLLIVGGALASTWLAIRAGHRAEFVQVSADVGQGDKIEESDLTTVELPEDFEGGIPEDEMDDIVGDVAATPWSKGMVVMDSMVTSDKKFKQQIVQLSLPVGALASNIDAGTAVAVYPANADPVAGTVASEPAGSEDSDMGSGGAEATISVPQDCGAEVVAAMQEDAVQVGILPAGDDAVRDSCNGG